MPTQTSRRKWRQEKQDELASNEAYTKIDGWETKVYNNGTDDFARWLKNTDAEFLSNRRAFIRGQERIAVEDRTLMGGFPCEWVREDAGSDETYTPSIRVQLADAGFQDIPLEWIEE